MNKPKGKHSVTSKKKGGWLAKVIVIGFLLAGVIGYIGYRKFYKPNVHIEQQENQKYLYIHTGATFEQVLSMLDECNCICDIESFEWMALKMNYPGHVRAGKYRLKNGMSNRELLVMLRSGEQEPVKVVFHNIRFKRDLASVISRQIEADSTSILRLLNNDNFLSKYGFSPQNAIAMLIPNTYELYWNTSAEEFLERMYKEYKRFWNEKHIQKAKNIELSPMEIAILASIVEEETQKNDEKRIIAGVYINRLKQNMLLQADPTVKFAYGDFSIKRVLNKYKETDSPYNTYKYLGLPPGPICIPSTSTLEAVLNYQKHEYVYFCAREDFSGYHNFARTIEQHNRNAQKYQKALTRAGIMR
jgi:UPF0755 protein